MWQGVCVLCVHCSQFSSSFHTMCFYVWRACYCLHMSIFFGLRSNVHIAHNAFFAHFFIYALRTQLSDFSQLRHLQCKMIYKESVYYGDLSDYMVVFLSGWFFFAYFNGISLETLKLMRMNEHYPVLSFSFWYFKEIWISVIQWNSSQRKDNNFSSYSFVLHLLNGNDY